VSRFRRSHHCAAHSFANMGHAPIQITMDTYGHLFPSIDDGAELAAAERALLA